MQSVLNQRFWKTGASFRSKHRPTRYFSSHRKGKKRSENKSVLKTGLHKTNAGHHPAQSVGLLPGACNRGGCLQRFFPLRCAVPREGISTSWRGSCAFDANLRKAEFVLVFCVPGLARFLSLSPGVSQQFPARICVLLGLEIRGGGSA